MKYVVVMVTTPNRATSLRLAKLLVGKKLAACVNIVPGLTSLFRWKGKVERAREELLVIKTAAPRYPALEKAVRGAHPYETCEILALPVDRGNPAYLRWIEQSLGSRP